MRTTQELWAVVDKMTGGVVQVGGYNRQRWCVHKTEKEAKRAYAQLWQPYARSGHVLDIQKIWPTQETDAREAEIQRLKKELNKEREILSSEIANRKRAESWADECQKEAAEDRLWGNCLRSAGVDNWEGYEHAMELVRDAEREKEFERRAVEEGPQLS